MVSLLIPPIGRTRSWLAGQSRVLAEHRFCGPESAPSSGQRGYQNPIRAHTKWIWDPFGSSIVADFAETAPNANTLSWLVKPWFGAGAPILLYLSPDGIPDSGGLSEGRNPVRNFTLRRRPTARELYRGVCGMPTRCSGEGIFF